MNLASRLSKLTAMSPAEIGGRARLTGLEAVERCRYRLGRLAPADRLRRAIDGSSASRSDWQQRLLETRRERPVRFFPSVEEPERMRALFAGAYAEEGRQTRAAADEVKGRRYGFFGETFTIPSGDGWRTDPVSGRRWPDGYHGDMPVSAGDVGCGDVKYVWEVNRHQFLVDLGKAWFIFRDAAAAADLRTIVLDWHEANPYATGVNWASPLEPAYRALSWLWAYFLTLDDPALTAADHATWVTGFYDQARFLHDHLELYASPYNHLIGEATALYLLGVLFPELAPARAWRRRGRLVLESRLAHQFYADGGTVEQATFYHHATLGFYLLAALVGRENGDDLPPAVWSLIERATEFSMCLTQPDGKVPAIGDTDDGKPIRLERRALWDFRPLLAAGAVLFDRGDFKCVAGRFHEDALWMLGPRGLSRYDALPASLPAESSRALEGSGYYVLRSGWDERADFVCFDCGEQAGGLRTDSVPSAAHGHADCLAVTLMLGGHEVLVDAGFFTYNGDVAWERFFRETAAHNTLRVDGEDQARHLNKMAWAGIPRATREFWRVTARGAIASGSHDGYTRSAQGAIHRRTVCLRPGYLALLDEVVGQGPHEVELSFQLGPGDARLVSGAGRLETGAGVLAQWFSETPLEASLRIGGAGPDGGWIAPSLGVREPAPRLTLKGLMSGPILQVLTLFADPARSGVPREVPATGPAHPPPLALALEAPGATEWILVPRGVPATIDRVSSSGRLAVWRFEGGRVVDSVEVPWHERL